MKNIKQWIAPRAASALLVSTLCLPAQDWPQWRGANRDGKTGPFAVPATWPTNLTQKWKISVGKSDSSPVLVGSNLYVFARQQGTDEVLFCLDAATGSARWKSTYPAGYTVGPTSQKDHPGPRSTPVVSGGKIFTLGIGGILSCFDTLDGKILWQKQSTNDYLGVAYKTEGAMSPIVEDGQCIVHVGPSTNGAVISFNADSGAPKWKWAGDGPANSSPVIMTAGGRKQLHIEVSGRAGPRRWQIAVAGGLRGRPGCQRHSGHLWKHRLLHRPGQGAGGHEDRAKGRRLCRDAPVEHHEIRRPLHDAHPQGRLPLRLL
jgi:hypothetical protein